VNKKGFEAMSGKVGERGVTLIEILVVVGIMGILLVASYPSILNTLENRDIENIGRDIVSTCQKARLLAVDTKADHRVRFAQVNGVWRFYLEREASTNPSTWVPVRDFLPKVIPAKFVVTVNLPADLAIQFSSMGVIEGYDSTRNTLTIQSLKLKSYSKPDLVLIRVFGGGSARFEKSTSG
jgi:prepilin-type N-terminal cleavage/methylation domain-containing protein